MFHALATKEDFWKERINVFVACAPVVMPNKKYKLFGLGSKIEKSLNGFLRTVRLWELFGHNWSSASRLLRTILPGFTFAESNLFTVVEFNDRNSARRFVGHYPHGASAR